MEWVETTGRTLEEAKDLALDQLGVDESEAEFEVLEEPKAGLFGRVRKEARVRARVRPTKPRSKTDRRDKKRSRTPRADGSSRKTDGGAPEVDGGSADGDNGGGQRQRAEPRQPSAKGGDGKTAKRTTRSSSKGDSSGEDVDGRSNDRQGSTGGKRPSASKTAKGGDMTGATLDQQVEIITPFLQGLLESFDLEGTVVHENVDDETVEIEVTGDDLGLLIGPKGQTLSAIQDLARTVVHRRVEGSAQGRVRLDIAGYRKRRKEALAEFTTRVAAEVLESGASKTLEPMHPADRKVVHDTVNGIDGVKTISEGEDSRRRVVILPAD